MSQLRTAEGSKKVVIFLFSKIIGKQLRHTVERTLVEKIQLNPRSHLKWTFNYINFFFPKAARGKFHHKNLVGTLKRINPCRRI